MKDFFISPQILRDRAVLRVAGETALAFLHNLLTEDLLSGKPAYGALLSPQGKILHDLFVVPDSDVVWIDVDAGQAADLLKRLMMYRLRAKLEISLSETKAVAAWTETGLHYADPRLPAMGTRAIVDAGTFAMGDGYDALRLSHGLGASSLDIKTGELFVHEANLDQLNGVSFSKGCYVGQEVVSRTQHRSTARNRILPVRFEGAVEAGSDITSSDKRVGTMLSSRAGQGLALMRLDRLAEISEPLLAGDVQVSVQKPLWAKFELTIPEVAQ